MGVFIVVYLCLIGATCWVAHRKGFAVWPMALFSIFLPGIGLIVVLVMKPNPGSLWGVTDRARQAMASRPLQVATDHLF